MYFEVGLDILQDAVSFIFDAAPQKMTSDLSSFVKVQVAEDSKLLLYFYDTDLIIKTHCLVDKPELGSCFLDLGLLYRSLSSLPPSDGKIVAKLDTQSVVIKSKSLSGSRHVNHKRVIPLYDAPTIASLEVDNDEKISITSDCFINGLKKVAASLTPYVDKNVMSGVLVENKSGAIKIASMNVVSITEYKSSNGLSRDFKCVIPGKVVGKIIKVLSRNKKEDQVYIAFSKDGSSMTIYTGVSVVSFPLSSEDFRDYSKLLNGYKGCATIDSSIFMDNIKNLWFALNKDDRFRVSLTFNGGEMTLSAGESDNTGIEVLGFNEEFHIDFNAFLLEAIVKNIPSEHFNIHFKSSSAPVMITNTDTTSESIVSVLAPLQ